MFELFVVTTNQGLFFYYRLSSVTKSLTVMRQNTGRPSKSESYGYGLPSSAVNGAMRLNQTLKSLDDIHEHSDVSYIFSTFL